MTASCTVAAPAKHVHRQILETHLVDDKVFGDWRPMYAVPSQQKHKIGIIWQLHL